MTELHLIFDAGGVERNGNDWDFPLKEYPSEAEVLAAVEKCRTGFGSAELAHIEKENESKPMLQLQADNGRYLLMLLEGDEVENGDVRALINPNPTVNPDAPEDMDYFDDELFPNQWIGTDFEKVLLAFKEFVRTGNVSTELMDYG